MYKYKNICPAFVTRLKGLMEERKTTIKELAKAIELSEIDCEKLLRGKQFSLDCLTSIAVYYKVSCDYLIGISNDRTPRKWR